MPITIKEAVERLNSLLDREIKNEDVNEVFDFITILKKELSLRFEVIEVLKYNTDYQAKMDWNKWNSAKLGKYEMAARFRAKEVLCMKVIELIKQNQIFKSTFLIVEEKEIYYFYYGHKDNETYLKEIILEVIKRKG